MIKKDDSDFDILVFPEYSFSQGKPILSIVERDAQYEKMCKITEGYDTLVLPGTYLVKEAKLLNLCRSLFWTIKE